MIEKNKVYQMDCLDLMKKLPDNYFDCIIFFDILEHLVDPYSLLCALKTCCFGGAINCESVTTKGPWLHIMSGCLSKKDASQ